MRRIVAFLKWDELSSNRQNRGQCIAQSQTTPQVREWCLHSSALRGFFVHHFRTEQNFNQQLWMFEPQIWSVGISRVDPLTSILAVLARSCQILTTSWQPWIPWQDSY